MSATSQRSSNGYLIRHPFAWRPIPVLNRSLVLSDGSSKCSAARIMATSTNTGKKRFSRSFRGTVLFVLRKIDGPRSLSFFLHCQRRLRYQLFNLLSSAKNTHDECGRSFWLLWLGQYRGRIYFARICPLGFSLSSADARLDSLARPFAYGTSGAVLQIL